MIGCSRNLTVALAAGSTALGVVPSGRLTTTAPMILARGLGSYPLGFYLSVLADVRQGAPYGAACMGCGGRW
jgi:hypothetical protein